jgi:hypothetical protein
MGDMPDDWTFLLTYWSRYPRKNLMVMSSQDILREGALCPEHARGLKRHLTAMDENSIVDKSSAP